VLCSKDHLHKILYLCLLHNWNYKCLLPHTACWLRWDVTNFLPSLASNCNPPNLHLLSSLYYRCTTMTSSWNSLFLDLSSRTGNICTLCNFLNTVFQ
jgi:hypothetical protein